MIHLNFAFYKFEIACFSVFSIKSQTSLNSAAAAAAAAADAIAVLIFYDTFEVG